jgi:hypothetical protein
MQTSTNPIRNCFLNGHMIAGELTIERIQVHKRICNLSFPQFGHGFWQEVDNRDGVSQKNRHYSPMRGDQK